MNYVIGVQKKETGDRMHCAEQDDQEHALLKCKRQDDVRKKLQASTRTKISVNNIIEAMLKSEENWNAMEKFMTAIIGNDDKR